MSKVKVKVCMGTACFVMGASHLQRLSEDLPEEIRDQVDVQETRCLDLCKNGHYRQGPYVEINGEIMDEASVPSVVEKITELLSAE